MEKPDVVTISAEEYAVEGTSVWVPLTDKEWPIPSGHPARIVSMTLMKTLWIQPKGSPRRAGQQIYSSNGRNQSTYRCRSFEWGQICPPPIDTGGQPSFQAVLPLLLDVPCIHPCAFLMPHGASMNSYQ